MQYPPAHTVDVIDHYHGTPVRDPYRWLENPDAPETIAFIEAQNKLTEEFLCTSPARERIRTRMTELMDYARYWAVEKHGSRVFYLCNDGLQNQPVLYMVEDGGEPQVLIDPNQLSSDGTVALTGWQFTDDGALMGYMLSSSGSDLQELHIRDVTTGRDHDDVIYGLRFSDFTWLPDKSGFYYNRYPDPQTVAPEDSQSYNRVYLHKLGTPQSDDQLIYERPDEKTYNFDPHITHDGRYLTLRVWYSSAGNNRFYYRELDGDFVRLLDEGDARYDFIGNNSTYFYFVTTADAPRGRIIAIDIMNPGRDNWIEIVPESDAVLPGARIVNGQLVLATMKNACEFLSVYNLNGTFEYDIPLPTLGAIWDWSGQADQTDLFFTFTSFLYPLTVFRFDMTTRQLTAFREPQLKFNPQDYETKQVFFPSKDGTQVSMFITYKRGLSLDGQNPTILYGYGGFNIGHLPMFNNPLMAWMEMGGVYADVNLRGGNEYGEAWHEAGMLDKKQNTFDDFNAAAEWLIANGYTSAKRLASYGGSNGGLLVTACMIQRPDLFGAVLCRVPVTDMLRFHKFPPGHFWTAEYGNAEENADHFEFMYAYSPLHTIKEGTVYPPILVATAEGDDRVVPLHSYKFIAELQARGGGDNPYLLTVLRKAGHGFGKPTSKVIDEHTDLFTFALKVFGV